MKSLHLAASVIFATTTMALAQEKVQITYSGVASINRLFDTNYTEEFLYGNGDVSLRWSTVNDIRFGADLGLAALSLLNEEYGYVVTEYYAAAVVEGRYGKVSIGMPRGVMDQFFTVPAFGGSEVIELLGYSSSDIVRILKRSEEEKLYGARYDTKMGEIEIAASAFRLNGSSLNTEEFAAKYIGDQWSVTLGTVRFKHGGISANSTSLEVQGHSGKISGGLIYSGSDVSDGDTIRGFVSYDIYKTLKLNTQVLHFINGAPGSEIYSFDLDFKHKTGVFINAGAIGSRASREKTFDVSVVYKF
jgi:hypothetical protein